MRYWWTHFPSIPNRNLKSPPKKKPSSKPDKPAEYHTVLVVLYSRLPSRIPFPSQVLLSEIQPSSIVSKTPISADGAFPLLSSPLAQSSKQANKQPGCRGSHDYRPSSLLAGRPPTDDRGSLDKPQRRIGCKNARFMCGVKANIALGVKW